MILSLPAAFLPLASPLASCFLLLDCWTKLLRNRFTLSVILCQGRLIPSLCALSDYTNTCRGFVHYVQYNTVPYETAYKVMSSIHFPQRKSIIPLLYSLLILIFRSSVVLGQSCYFSSGTIAPTFTPCNGTASASHCCSPSDACLTSGLCYMKWDHSINVGTCTDQSWRDPNCFQLCPKTTGEFFQNRKFGLEA